MSSIPNDPTLVDDPDTLSVPLHTEDLEALAEPEGQLEVELLPDGRMRAPQAATRRILRDRLRHAEVLPTGAGWAVLRSLGSSAVEDTSRSKRVVAAGSLGRESISLVDFIGFLANGYETGVLTVASGHIERSLYFYKGDVVWAASTVLDDRFGQFLLQRGRISQEQLSTVTNQTGNTRIGRLCVDRGYLSPHELWSLVQDQLRQIFDRMLIMERGMWSFARVSSEVLAESQIHFSTQGLLVDTLRRLDELKVYRQRLPNGDVLLERVLEESTADLVKKLDKDQRSEAEALLQHVSGPIAIKELMRVLHTGEFEVTRAAYHLIRANLVRVVEGSGAPENKEPAVNSDAAREIMGTYSMAIREMFDELGRVGKVGQLRNACRGFLQDEAGSGAYARLLQNVKLQPDGTLEEKPLLEAAEAAGVSARGLSDALSELLFFVLFRSTEILGRRRGDDLARRVKMIHSMLSPDALGTAS